MTARRSPPTRPRRGPPTHPSTRRRGPRPDRRWRASLTALALLMAAVWLVPLLWALSTSVKPEEETRAIPPEWFASRITGEAYQRGVRQQRAHPALVPQQHARVGVGDGLGVLVLCSLAAYGFSRTDFRGRRWLFAPVVAAIVVPSQVLIIPLFDELDALGLVDTYWAIILPQLVAPAMVFILKKFFDGIPREYEEAAADRRGEPAADLPDDRSSRCRCRSSVAVGDLHLHHHLEQLPLAVRGDHRPRPDDAAAGPARPGRPRSSSSTRRSWPSAVLGGLPLLIIYVLFQRQVITRRRQRGPQGMTSI